MEEKIKLGDKVKDKITGAKGVATEKHESLHGPVRFGVEPTREEVPPGWKPGDAIWFHEDRLTTAV